MDKNSFTLFETLISIILLLVVIVGFNKYAYYDNFDKEFMLLNEIENSFNIETYDENFSILSKNIKIIINDSEEKTIPIKIYKYENEKIKLIKYKL
ncbi:hypothetical protein [Arcobacter sp. LA11]|uniref:hypothetical protein n=1 Tax=Arcobacter sp. LA11 TaxID=1898176 RepID=UPI0009330A5F|nr:hypothetical protein [Arcobacter sp. LA11]